MWRDVFLNNDAAVLEMLQRFSEDLSYLQRAIRWQEGDKLEEIFTRTREIRRSIIDAGQIKHVNVRSNILHIHGLEALRYLVFPPCFKGQISRADRPEIKF